MSLCKNPFMAGALAFGCGQCLPCRINKRREWTWRQFLESLCHERNCFVTLTYSDRHIAGNWQLQPDDLRLFFYRFRKAIRPVKIRYYACGEYGEDRFRPHYHITLFGVSGYTRINGKGVVERDGLGRIIGGWIYDLWGRGQVHVADEVTHLTAQYVAGYTTKKITDLKNGRTWNYPEFARMSNRPGIGAPAMGVLARQLLHTYTDWESGDVPAVLTIGQRRIPLFRYLVKLLRTEVGFSDEYVQMVKQRKSFERSVELQALFNSMGPNQTTFKAAYLHDIEGRLRQVEAREHLRWQKGKV